MKRGIPMELRPTQRFPEFIGQKLHDVRLGEVTEESTARNGSRLPPASVMGVRKEDGIVQMEGRLVAADISRYKLVGSNWFAYNPMRLNIGSIARWQGDSVVLVSPDYVVFRCLEQSTPAALHPEYLDHFRRSSQWDAFVNEAGDGGVRVRIYYRDISQLRLIVPDVVEQQKIADCLGSLDDLIAAERRKLEALRQHKQGLMQQLFPQPGETQPRLRLPEFQDTQEWHVAPLGKLFETTTGGTPDRARPDYWGGEVPWVTTSIVDFNVIESTRESISSAGLSNSSAKVFPKRTVLVALYGQGKTRGKVAMLGVEAATNQACAAILPSDEVDPRFVFLNLSGRYEEIRANSNSGGQKNLSQALVRDLPFAYPKERAEQHRIAECLTALDDQIAAQARKLETLKQHKRGLLQQLFPKPETA